MCKVFKVVPPGHFPGPFWKLEAASQPVASIHAKYVFCIRLRWLPSVEVFSLPLLGGRRDPSPGAPPSCRDFAHAAGTRRVD